MTYDAYAPRTKTAPTEAEAVIGHNRPPEELVFDRIKDLYEEAKNWADGEPITSEEAFNQVTEIDNQLATAFKEAEEFRTKQKAPHDAAAKAVQDKFNPYTQKGRGLVDKARDELKAIKSVYARRKAAEQAEKARILAEAAVKAAEEARAAMQESAGNLQAREDAEEIQEEAKTLARQAARASKTVGVGLGLRTVKRVTILNDFDAVEWAYNREKKLFTDLALSIATEYSKRMNVQTIPGFVITNEKE